MENLIRKMNPRSWFVIYTRPRWEKKVDQLLKQRGINSFCPLKAVESQWADRRKIVELPLFNSYVFVNINMKEELAVRQTRGVLNFIYFMSKPATISDKEIDGIRTIMTKYKDVQAVSLKDLIIGDRVTIKRGILSNHEGSIIQIGGKTVLMALDHLECALITRVPVTDLSTMQYE
jgi:transcriptional antiterminator RfaH